MLYFIYSLAFLLFSVFYLLTSSRIAIPGITILRWIGSVLLFLTVILGKKRGDKTGIYYPKAYIWLLIAFIPTFLGFAGSGTLYAWERIISLFLVCGGLEAFLGRQNITTKEIVKYLKIYTVISGLLMVLSLITPNNMHGRSTGIYRNANFLSSIAVFTLASSFSLFFYSDKLLKKLVWLLFAVAGIICVIQSGSRAGLVTLIIVVFSIPIVTKNKRSFKSTFAAFLGIGIVFILVSYVFSHADILSFERLTNAESAGEALSRGATWRDVGIIFKQKPIFGWGYGQVGYRVFVDKDNSLEWGMHSSYFVILCEMGILGTLCFLGFFLTYFKDIYKRFKNNLSSLDRNEIRFLKMLIVCIIAMLINAYSESFLFSVGNPMSICFWLPLILLHKYTYIIENKRIT